MPVCPFRLVGGFVLRVCVFCALITVISLTASMAEASWGSAWFQTRTNRADETGGLSVCLSLPAELMFDQGQTERE